MRMLVSGLVFLLLLGIFSPVAPQMEAANSRGPLLAAWLASELEGVPHRFGGADPQSGMDNSGLIYYVYQKIGADMPRALSAQASYGTKVDKQDLVAGDLVFFNNPNTSRIVHVGIYLGDGDFVASSSSTNGVVRRNLNQSYYVKHYVGARRVPAAAFRPAYEALGQIARATVGLPYRAAGASAQGVDNVGLIKYIYGQYFVPLPADLDALAKMGVSVSRSQLRPGDMIFFRGANSATPYRVGMYIGNNEFVVIDQDLGRVVQRSLTTSFYRNRYLYARRPYANFTPPASFAAPGGEAQPQPQPKPEPQPEPSAPPIAEQLVAAALKHVGKPYRLGANGPSVFDCSGLTSYVFRQFGYILPRASYSQAKVGQAVSYNQLQPGDLVFFKNTWRNDGRVDHVAIYMGDGRIVHAIRSGVTTSSLRGYWLDHYAGARRILDP